MAMNDPFLLFDLDGTLSDPLIGIARSINYALEAFEYETRPIPDLAKYVGPPLDETFQVLTGVRDKTEIMTFISKFRERYGDTGFSENKLYPGIKEALQTLAGHDVPMAVCTSKRGDFAEKVLELFDLRPCFRFVSGGDVGIPKWRQIESLLAHGAIDENALMIGDRDVDLIAAHKNGIKSVGVLWGYGSYDELAAHSPARLLSKPSELEKLMDAR